MAQCKYDSQLHGLMLPVVQDVNGIAIPNVEPQHTEIVNHFILNKLSSEKRKKCSDTVQYKCQQYFCSFCLKLIYDTYLADI